MKLKVLLAIPVLVFSSCTKPEHVTTDLLPRTSGVVKISAMRDGEQGCTLNNIVAVDRNGEMIDGRADITLTTAPCQPVWKHVEKKGQAYYVLYSGADPELQTSVITRVATDADWPR